MNISPATVGQFSLLLEVRNLTHEYRVRSEYSGKWKPIVSLHEIDLELRAGVNLALVGASGSGKSTLVKCIARLEKPARGEIFLEGRNIWSSDAGELQSFRRQVQMVYQDSATSLNPRFTNEEIVAEPFVVQGMHNKKERRNLALAQMEQVGLSADLAGRRPLELSGGQRQRLAIARALILKPKLLIFDESFSGLDLLVQKSIAEMLRSLQSADSLTYLFVTHDLALAQQLASEIAVLQEGRIVERISSADLFTLPRHAYTRRLADSTLLIQFGSAARKVEAER